MQLMIENLANSGKRMKRINYYAIDVREKFTMK